MARIKAVEFDGRRSAEADELDLHDEPLGRPRFADPDAPARRHARPDGQAVGRDHRDADHLELQGRPDRARVLQLDPRRPQGSGRHRPEDGQLGLPDPSSRRRGAGLHRQLRSTAAPTPASPCSRSSMPARSWPRSATRILGRTALEDIDHPVTGDVLVKGGTLIDEARRRGDREGRHPVGPHPLGADLRDPDRRLRGLLRSRPGARHAGQHGRSGRRHRGAVDRRAGHPAHHAYVPHGRHGAGRRPVVPGSVLTKARSQIRNRNVVRNSDGQLVAMGRNMAIADPRRAPARSAPRTASPTVRASSWTTATR